MTHARHSSIGRDIIRGIDIDQNYKRSLDTAAIARSPEHNITETIPPPKEALVDTVALPATAKQTELDSIAEPKEADLAELSATRDIVIDLDEVEIDSFETHRVDETNATVDILVKWGNGEQSWESEWNLRQQVLVLIYKYWDTVGRRDAAQHSLPADNERDHGLRGQYYACHAEKQLIAYFVNTHVVLTEDHWHLREAIPPVMINKAQIIVNK
ncbi:hypothetical protein EDB80DRAFT_900606 [Ilyonectria destructans]|nr:hypothetical protein EDB80DRAFT_900606 [Ilyonectria destructans]